MKDTGGSQSGVFLTDAHDYFMDWFNVVYYSIGKKPYIWGLTEERSLPPLTFLLLYPFSKLYGYDVSQWVENDTRYTARYTQLPMVAATMVFIVSYLLLFYSLYKNCRGISDLKKAVIFVVFFLSGVNLFCIDRGNLQVITAAALFIYIYACDRDSSIGWLRTGIGLLCLAFAAAIKLFPAMMGILLLYRRKWKEAAVAFVMGMALFLLPFLWMEQPFLSAIGSFLTTLGEHAGSYRTIAEFGFSTPAIMSLTGLPYGLLQALAYIAALISIFFANSHISGWKRLMLLTLTLILTSGQQGYYCLMFLLLPVALFFCEEHPVADVIYVILFAVILSPLQRTVRVAGASVSARDVINIILIVLYIILMTEAVWRFRTRVGDTGKKPETAVDN
jgi:hypothetical protein